MISPAQDALLRYLAEQLVDDAERESAEPVTVDAAAAEVQDSAA